MLATPGWNPLEGAPGASDASRVLPTPAAVDDGEESPKTPNTPHEPRSLFSFTSQLSAMEEAEEEAPGAAAAVGRTKAAPFLSFTPSDPQPRPPLTLTPTAQGTARRHPLRYLPGENPAPPPGGGDVRFPSDGFPVCGTCGGPARPSILQVCPSSSSSSGNSTALCCAVWGLCLGG
jgi:hypothetical protein